MATSPPSFHDLFPPNKSDKNFEIAFVMKIVKMSHNKNSGVNTTPQSPRAGVVSYAPGVYTVLMAGATRINFKEGSFDWKFKVLAQFLRVKNDLRVTAPPPSRPFSPNDKYFEIGVLLKIVQIIDKKKKSRCRYNPQGFGSGSRLCPGGICGSYRRDGCINFREGLFE